MPEVTRFLGLTETINGDGRTVFIIGRVESQRPQQFFIPAKNHCLTSLVSTCNRGKGRLSAVQRQAKNLQKDHWLLALSGIDSFTEQKSLISCGKRFGFRKCNTILISAQMS